MIWLAFLLTVADAAITHQGVTRGLITEANPLIPSLRTMWTVMVPLRLAIAAAFAVAAPPAALLTICLIWVVPLVWNPLLMRKAARR